MRPFAWLTLASALLAGASAGALSLTPRPGAATFAPPPTELPDELSLPVQTVTPKDYWTEVGRLAQLRLKEMGCQMSFARFFGTTAAPGAELCYREGLTSVCVRARMSVVGDMSYAVSLSNGPHPCDTFR